jgi:type IV secretory pathway TrbF-like protein
MTTAATPHSTNHAPQQTARTPAEIHAAGQIEQAHRESRRWFLVSMLLLVPAILPWGIIWHVASQSRVEPYPVVIDPGGMVLYHGPPGSYDREELWTMTFLQEWLKVCRERRDDAVLMAERHEACLRPVVEQAVWQVQGYLKAIDLNGSAQRANPIRVQLGAFRWHPPSGQTYEVEWSEKWTPTYGQQVSTLRVSARLVVDRRQQTDRFGLLMIKAKDMNRNPMGIYITSISWFEEWAS